MHKASSLIELRVSKCIEYHSKESKHSQTGMAAAAKETRIQLRPPTLQKKQEEDLTKVIFQNRFRQTHVHLVEFPDAFLATFTTLSRFELKILHNWVLEVFCLLRCEFIETWFLYHDIFQRVLRKRPQALKRLTIQRTGLTCMWIAIKISEVDSGFDAEDLADLCDNAFSKRSFLMEERQVLHDIQFRCHRTTVYHLLKHLVYLSMHLGPRSRQKRWKRVMQTIAIACMVAYSTDFIRYSIKTFAVAIGVAATMLESPKSPAQPDPSPSEIRRLKWLRDHIFKPWRVDVGDVKACFWDVVTVIRSIRERQMATVLANLIKPFPKTTWVQKPHDITLFPYPILDEAPKLPPLTTALEDGTAS